jgi:hypothetical protein
MVSLAPAVVIGLGTGGNAALEEFALFVLQADDTGASSVALLGMSFERVQATGFQPYLINADLEAWLRDKNSARQPAIQPWFDVQFYSRDDKQALHERQIARARFLKHLQEHAGEFETFLKVNIRRVWQNRQDNTRPLLVHLLASVADAESALIMDVVNFVHRALRGVTSEARIVLHLALTEVAQNARAFAVFRELERFAISYGDTIHEVYPAGSGFEKYNARSSMMIHNLKLYQPPSETDVAALWVDAILPQLDPRPDGFGAHYLQVNLTNWNTWREVKIQEAKNNRYELYGGTYLPRSAIFPLEYLRRYWSAQLAYEVLETWLGQPDRDHFNWLETDWFHTVRTLSNGQRVTCPAFVKWLLTLEEPNGLTAEQAQHIMFEGERDNAFLMAHREAHREALEWKPVSAQFPQQNVHAFTQSVENAITRYFGGSSSLYQNSIFHLAHLQIQRFEDSLRLFLRDLVEASGSVRQIDALLQDYLLPRLNDVAGKLNRAAQESARELREEALEEKLIQSGRRITALKKPFLGGETEEVRRYMAYAQRVTERLKKQVAIEALADTACQLRDITARFAEAIGEWREALWASPDSLLQLTKAEAEQQLRLPTTPFRLWLMKWISPRLQGMLRSEYADDGKLIIYLKRDSEQLLSSDAQARKINFLDWTKLVETQVRDVSFDLWDDYLAPHETYRSLLPELQRFFGQGNNNQAKGALVEANYLILPVKLREDAALIESPLGKHLVSRNVPPDQVFYTSDPTRLVFYSSSEAFAVSETQGYQRARDAYLALDRQERSRLHVMAAEVEAVRWEMKTRKNAMFSGSVVALLAHEDRVRQFILLEALGMIRILPYNDELDRYALQLREGVWWLTSLAQPTSRLAAINTIVFTGKPVQFGIPPYLSERLLPRDLLNAAVTEKIQQMAANRDETPYTDDRLKRYLNLLSSHQQWARQLAEEVETLQVYHQQIKQMTQRHHNDRDEHDLLQLLALIARSMSDEQVALLRSRIH